MTFLFIHILCRLHLKQLKKRLILCSAVSAIQRYVCQFVTENKEAVYGVQLRTITTIFLTFPTAFFFGEWHENRVPRWKCSSAFTGLYEFSTGSASAAVYLLKKMVKLCSRLKFMLLWTRVTIDRHTERARSLCLQENSSEPFGSWYNVYVK